MYTVKEFAAKTGLSCKIVYNWAREGKLRPKCITEQGVKYYTQAQVDEYNTNKVKLPADAKKIEGAVEHWVDRKGNIYARSTTRTGVFKKALTKNYGYAYCGIMYEGEDKPRSKRVHRLVAEAFIPNPYNLPIVGHRNNIKDDNRVENLYWTTVAENTQKAYDEGLVKNAKGFSDSQSKPVVMYDTATNDRLRVFGSMREAEKETGIALSTIGRQARYHRPVRKKYYFRFLDDETTKTTHTKRSNDHRNPKRRVE